VASHSLVGRGRLYICWPPQLPQFGFWVLVRFFATLTWHISNTTLFWPVDSFCCWTSTHDHYTNSYYPQSLLTHLLPKTHLFRLLRRKKLFLTSELLSQASFATLASFAPQHHSDASRFTLALHQHKANALPPTTSTAPQHFAITLSSTA